MPIGQLAEAEITGFDSTGRPNSGILTLDYNANGKGWFIDTTPWENSEFGIQNSETSFQAQPGSEASGKYDLLTTILHELAHLNGIIYGNPAFDQFVQRDGTNLHFVAPGITAQLTPDGSHLDSTAHPNSLMNTTLRLGQRKLPTALELKIIETLQTTTLKELYSDKPYSLEAPLSAGALLAILNGDFETPNSGWQIRGDSNILNGQAILSENSKYLSNLRQTFTVPEGAKALQFTLVTTHLDDSDQAPPDAFEVALLDEQNQSVVQTAQGLTQTDALLNIQHDGTTYYGDQVKLLGANNSGDTLDFSAPRTVQIDLSNVPAGTVVTLFFDLLGFGEKDASVIIDDVQLLTELSQAPIAQNDDATVFANSDTQLDILANDQDPDGTIDPATVQIIGTPNNGTVTTNPDGTVTYTPNSGFFGLDEFIYIVQDNNGVISNSAKVSLIVLDPAPTIESLSIESDLKEGTPAHFSASATSASNSPLTYTWDLGDGTTTEGDTLNHTYTNNGTYTVTLTVTNDNGISSIERRTVTVENLAPRVDLTGPTSVNEGETFTLNASFTDPGILDTHTITWDFGDGTSTTDTLTPDHTYSDNGTYTASVTITDNDGASTTESLFITVQNVNPTLNTFTGNLTPNEGQPETYSATASDPGDDTVTYTWDFGDGSEPVVGQTVEHTYGDNGTYTLTLTLSDEDGGETLETFSVSVQNVAPSFTQVTGDTPINEGDQAQFSATATDPGNDSLTYTWNFGDGSDHVEGANPTHTYADNGTYTASVTVTDDDGASSTQTLTIQVTNVAPTVNIGDDQTASEGDTISFNASFTDPGILDTHTLTWDFGDGSSAEGTLDPTHIYGDNGLYLVTLTVTDNDGAATQSTLTVTVNNAAPVITSLTGDTEVNEGTLAQFAVTATDPGQDILTYTWSFGDGSDPVTGSTAEHTYTDNGQFIVTLIVADDDGASTTQTLTITVLNVNPVLDSFTGNLTPNEGQPETYSATASDPGDDSITYTWNFGDGSDPIVGQTVQHTYADNGTYTLTLTLTDEDGGETLETFTVDVQNIAPTVNAGGDLTSNEGESLIFNGSYSDPGVNDTHTLTWNFGDGNTLTGNLTPAHTYADNGTYTATLTVTDNDGASTTQTLTVEVSNVAPTVNIGQDLTRDEGELVVFNASFTDPGILDTHTIEWNFGDGTQTTGTLTPSHTYADNGLYLVTLTITDSDGAATSATLNVTVNNVAPVITALTGDTQVNEGSPARFSAIAVDPGNDTLTYTWNFGDGSPTVLGANVEHTYADNGTYTVTLVVSDEDGASTTQTLSVAVQNVSPTLNSFTGNVNAPTHDATRT